MFRWRSAMIIACDDSPELMIERGTSGAKSEKSVPEVRRRKARLARREPMKRVDTNWLNLSVYMSCFTEHD